MDIKERINEILPELIAIRRDLHSHPELSNMEFQTMDKVSRFLTNLGIEHQTKVADTGIVGIIRGNQSGKTVAARADMDALPIQEGTAVSYSSQNPGVMHACGHDVHTTILLGVAKILSELPEELPGNVKLFFQPAEETTGGAERMIMAGCMENPTVDATIGLHVGSDIEVGHIAYKYGKISAASGEFTITVHGKSGHGAHPDSAVDAIVIASYIVTALQTLVSRNISAVDSIVLTIGSINGGTKSNIIADTVVMEGILRSLDKNTRKLAKERISCIIENTATSLGGSAEIDFQESYIANVNTDEIMDVIKNTATRILGVDKVHLLDAPSLGAEDFSYFASASKGGFYDLGCANFSKGLDAPLHNKYFNVDEECIKYGVLLQVECLLELLKSPTI